VVGVMGELWCVPEMLNMPQCLRNRARLESCKPCQGAASAMGLVGVGTHEAF
jgi:hypothetical protein